MRTMVNYDYIFIQSVTAVPIVATVSKLSDGETSTSAIPNDIKLSDGGTSTSAIPNDIIINTAVVEKQVEIQSTIK